MANAQMDKAARRQNKTHLLHQELEHTARNIVAPCQGPTRGRLRGPGHQAPVETASPSTLDSEQNGTALIGRILEEFAYLEQFVPHHFEFFF